MSDDDAISWTFKAHPQFVFPLFGVCRSCGSVWPGTWLDGPCPADGVVVGEYDCRGRVRALTPTEAVIVEVAYRIGHRDAVCVLRFGSSV